MGCSAGTGPNLKNRLSNEWRMRKKEREKEGEIEREMREEK
jgi:hypothetical protein